MAGLEFVCSTAQSSCACVLPSASNPPLSCKNDIVQSETYLSVLERRCESNGVIKILIFICLILLTQKNMQFTEAKKQLKSCLVLREGEYCTQVWH